MDLLNEGVDDPGILKCIFLAGGPGSGKSTVAKDLFGISKVVSFSASGLKTVNSDNAFEAGLKKNGIDSKQLANIEKNDPELWDIIQGKSADSIRNQAKVITNQMRTFYEAGRLGMIVDGTGNDTAKIKSQKERAEKLGYDCYMVFVNTSLEVAKYRNSMRDRVMPDNLVTSIWKDCQNNMGKFQTMFSGNFRIVDNSKTGNNITSDIQKGIDSFMREPLRNPIGKKWVIQARILKQANVIKR
jgi:predicted kinase